MLFIDNINSNVLRTPRQVGSYYNVKSNNVYF